MSEGSFRKFAWLCAALFLAGLSGLSAQETAPKSGIDIPAIVAGLALSGDKAADARTVLDGFVAQIQESSTSLVGLLSQKKPEQLLDPQVSAKINQVQKGFALKFEMFQMDLADVAGNEKALKVVAQFRAAIPAILLGDTPAARAATPAPAQVQAPAVVDLAQFPAGIPAANKPVEVPLGSSNLDLAISADPAAASSGGMMGMMSGMMSMMSSMMGMMPMPSSPGTGAQAMAGTGMAPGSASSPMPAAPVNAQLLQQYQTTSSLISQLLATFAAQPGGVTQSQMQLISQLIASQNATLQLLLGASGGTTPAASTMPAGSSMKM